MTCNKTSDSDHDSTRSGFQTTMASDGQSESQVDDPPVEIRDESWVVILMVVSGFGILLVSCIVCGNTRLN